MKDKKLRSSEWFGGDTKMGFVHRSWMRNQGHPDHMFNGRPVIGICNTWSDLTPCNAHLRDFAEIVKRGVYEAGGFPLEFPVMSLGETLMKPSTMLYRNLASMDVEESIRANPLDGIVLLTGCDKTTPSTIMGACSVDLPTLVVPGGPMLNGYWKGQKVGSGTLTWQISEGLVKGEITGEELREAESCMSRSAGHCMTMGTASSMACTVEALGLTLPNAAAIPAVDSRKKVMAHLAGNRIVEMVKEDLTLSKVLTREAFENAIKINASIGGSTNVVLHLLAIARRIGVSLDLEDFDALASRLPMIVNLMPAGDYLMEDLFYAGGLSAVVNAMKEHLKPALTVNGKSLVENAKTVASSNSDVISDLEHPFMKEAGIAILKGNLCEKGAVIKPCAASPHLMKHRGRAVVFESIEDYHERVNDPNLDIDKDCVMVLKGVGPVGYPGMPEVGNMTLPKKLLDQGVNDMVRISDGRMSGTAYGTVVLHIAPESSVGGTLALVQNGDMISLDVENRSLQLDVSATELAARKKNWQAPPPQAKRGYAKLYIDSVNQADEGCDLDFLKGGSGSEVSRDLH
ncbi:MAG: IlvD/Edd family dehydratase [Flavobacteriaceae bacterium]|jgi:dihydroxy-acid dehydratase